MKIGIYKPGKPIFFGNGDGDTSGWSPEITGTYYILIEAQHNVLILSETDRQQTITKKWNPELLLIFNGKFTDEDYKKLSNYKCPKVLCVTDLALLPDSTKLKWNYSIGQTIDKNVVDDYFPFHQLVAKRKPVHLPEIQEKNVLFCFGGNERNRTQKLISYIGGVKNEFGSKIAYYGKSKSLGIINKIPFYQLQEMYMKSKYSVVFTDPDYEVTGFITQRYYELILNNVIAFVDKDYDRHEICIRKNDFRRVKNHFDLIEKIYQLENDPDKYIEVLQNQIEEGKQLMERIEHIGDKLLRIVLLVENEFRKV